MADDVDKISQDLVDANEKYADEQRKAAEKARADNKDEGETEEEYNARINSVPGIFGDTETSVEQPVVSAQNETANLAVSQKDAAAEQGDEDAAKASDNQARRQVDAELGTTGFADDVDEAAQDADDKDKSSTGSKSKSK